MVLAHPPDAIPSPSPQPKTRKRRLANDDVVSPTPRRRRSPFLSVVIWMSAAHNIILTHRLPNDPLSNDSSTSRAPILAKL
jgi:hypothetical protein